MQSLKYERKKVGLMKCESCHAWTAAVLLKYYSQRISPISPTCAHIMAPGNANPSNMDNTLHLLERFFSSRMPVTADSLLRMEDVAKNTTQGKNKPKLKRTYSLASCAEGERFFIYIVTGLHSACKGRVYGLLPRTVFYHLLVHFNFVRLKKQKKT